MSRNFSLYKRFSKGFKTSIVEGVITTFGNSFSGPMLIPFFIRRGASVEFLSLYVSLGFILSPISQLLSAFILNNFREKRREIMFFSALISRSVWIFITFSTFSEAIDVNLLLIVILALRPFGILTNLAWTDLLTDLVEIKIRGRAFAFRNSVVGLSRILGLSLSTIIYAMPYPISYQYAFVIGTILMLSSTPLLYLYGDPVKPKGMEINWKKVKEIFTNKTILKDSLSIASWSSSVNIVGAIWTYHLFNKIGATEDWIVLINLTGSIIGILGNAVWGRAYDRFGPKNIFLLSGPGIALIPILFPHLPSLIGQIGLQAYSSFLWSGFSLASFNYAVSFDPSLRPFYIAIYNSVPSIAASVSTQIGAYTYEKYGIIAFYISGLLRLVALFILSKVVSSRGVSYDELKLSGHLYRIVVISKDIATFATFEIFYALRIFYTLFIVSLLLALLISIYTLALIILKI